MKTLTKSEKEIMNVLWRAERALTHAEIVSACVERKWRARSIFEMLNSLLDKGYVRAVGYERSVKTYSRTFEAVVSQAEYLAGIIKDANLPPEQLSELIQLLKV